MLEIRTSSVTGSKFIRADLLELQRIHEMEIKVRYRDASFDCSGCVVNNVLVLFSGEGVLDAETEFYHLAPVRPGITTTDLWDIVAYWIRDTFEDDVSLTFEVDFVNGN